MNNDIEKVLFSEEQLQRRVREMGAEISRDYAGKNPTMVCILKGAVMFYTDLLRNISVPLTMDFMAVSSYGNKTKSSGEVEIRKD
ncbi:MAG: phosphoribosyltransferase, partial [Aristaeellaceae bacterium]